MKKFDLYQELANKGFIPSEDQYGRHCMTLTLERKICGEHTTRMEILVAFNKEHTVATVYYSNGGHEPFKVKTHLNEKRTLNAIIQTARNNMFEI